MERVLDSIDGKAVAVVYGAEQIELSTEAGRWSRSGQLRRLAKRYGASHLLRAEGLDSDHETWWLGQAGVSFAAAIEAWAMVEPDVDDDVVLVPLDDRIYVAELDGGEVGGEKVIGEKLLGEHFQAWRGRGRTVRAFEAGSLGYVLDGMAALEPLPFGLRSMVYRPAAFALGAVGLFAPTQAVAVATVGVALAGWQFYSDWREDAVDEAAQVAREAEERAAALQADFSAAAVLRGFAGLVWDESCLVLHRGGLRQASFAGGFEVVLDGVAEGYPKGAERYADAHGGGVVVSGEAWQVTRVVGWGAPQLGSVVGIGGRRLAANLYEIADFPRAQVAGRMAVPAGPAEERSFSVQVEAPTRRDFELLAAGVDELPYRVAAVSCTFEDYLAVACDVSIVAKGELQ
ncbi:MAG: hypothetical protein OXQ90_19105 [Gammaproteobacteria bacterium]|nr:hypothetical protein [Gammaproteobacteria bacterium]